MCERSVYAQSTQAELFGMVRDATGLSIAGSSIALTNAATGLKLTQASGADGGYRFLALPAGEYRIEVGRENFTPFRREGVLLHGGDLASLDVELRLSDSRQTMDVIAVPPLLQSTRGTVNFQIEERQIVNLPLDGRNFVPLMALAPGVALPPGSTLPRINGSRPRVSEYIYDGVSVLQPEPGQVAYFPVIDAVAEFRVETNSYSAEYGRSNGGVIIVNQKSGTNVFHGSLFEFLRNEKLNARNFFAGTGPKPRFRRNQFGLVAGGPLQKDQTFCFADWQSTRLNTGVIRQSSVPTSAERTGVFATAVFDPFTTARTDLGYVRMPFAGNVIPTSRFDRAARAVVDRYPVPNVLLGSGAQATANNYSRLGNDDTVANQLDGRLDRYFGQRQRIFGRYSFLRDDSRPTTPLPDGSGNLTTGVIGNTITRADGIAVEHTWNATPAAVNQFRFGYTRRQFDRSSSRLSRPVRDTTLIPNIPVSSFADVLPTYDIVGLQQLGPPSSGNAEFSTSVMQFIDNYSWVRGRHSLKAGVDIRRQSLDVLQPSSPTGNFQFTSIFTGALGANGAVGANTGASFASFLLGQVSRFSVDAQPEVIEPRASSAEFFLQDDFRATSRLSLNLGVRYTLNLPSTVRGNRGAVFNLETQRLDLLGSNGFPRTARGLEKGNFAPRLGLAYQLRNSLVLRAGYGFTWIEQTGLSTPFTTPLFPYIQTLTEQTLNNIDPAFVLSDGPSVRVHAPGPDAGLGQAVFGVQRDNGSGYAQQWNLSLQRTLGTNWSVEGGYVASKLTRLGVPDVNLNQLTVEQLALGSPLTESVANPFFEQIPANSQLGGARISRAQLLRSYPRFSSVALYRNNVGHSTYHSLQARVEKRFSAGLSFTMAYTFSRLIDDAGAVFDSAILTGPVIGFQAADSFNRHLEKDASTGHVPHTFASGFVYELPLGRGRARNGFWERLAGGWQVAGLVRAQSGSPLAVTQATNLNAFAGFGIQRPNRPMSPELPSGPRTVSRWFNPAAFSAAPQFAIGNSSRNPVTGPGYRTLDGMVGKSFFVREGLRVEVRAEAFNATNTPSLGNPNGQFGTVAFGTITTAQDPRVYELVLKLHF